MASESRVCEKGSGAGDPKNLAVLHISTPFLQRACGARKKLQPEVTPSLLSRTGGYVSVEGQETEDKMVMSACCAAP